MWGEGIVPPQDLGHPQPLTPRDLDTHEDRHPHTLLPSTLYPVLLPANTVLLPVLVLHPATCVRGH